MVKYTFIILILALFIFLFYVCYREYLIRSIYSRYKIVDFIFRQSKELAYLKIYREDIYKYTASGTIFEKKELPDKYSKYIDLVKLFCGPAIFRDLLIIYGDIDTLCALLINDFTVRLEDSEIEHTTKVIAEKVNRSMSNGG